MVIKELLSLGTARLLAAEIDTARLEADVLLAHALKKDKLFLLVNPEYNVAESEQDLFLSFIKRREENEPVSYITGVREFMSLDFFVSPGVLIPRPDTETLCELVIEKFSDKKIKLLELGTGSGAICISLLYYLKNATALGIDISPVCLDLCEKSAKKHGVDSRLSLLRADMLKPLVLNETFDCIVSNPPYIKTDDMLTLSSTVKDYEPVSALDGGDDGLLFYRKIAEIAPALLSNKGFLALEIGCGMEADVKELLEATGMFCEFGTKSDLFGIKRVVFASKRL